MGGLRLDIIQHHKESTHRYKYCDMKIGLEIQSLTKFRVQKPNNPIWLPGSHFEIHTAENHEASCTQEMCYCSLDLIFEAKLKPESGNKKIQYGHLAATLKVISLKTNRLLLIYIFNVLLKRGLDIQSQTKVRFQEPKNPIHLPGSHFLSHIAENR